MFQTIASFFGSGAGQGLLQAGASLGGQLLSSSANKRAASQMRGGYSDYAAAIRAANEAAQRRYEEAKGYATPAMAALQRVVAAPADALTPAQQIGLEDSHRRATAAVAASGMRGAGRAGVGAIMDNSRRYVAGAQESNQGRSDAASRTLAGTYNTAISGQAQSDRDTGQAAGRAALGSAEEGAAGDLASSRGWGQTLGVLSNVIARGNKGGPTYDAKFSNPDYGRSSYEYARGGRIKRGRKPPPMAARAPAHLGGGRPVPITAHEGEYVLPAPVVNAAGGADRLDAAVRGVTGIPPNGSRVMARGGRAVVRRGA